MAQDIAGRHFRKANHGYAQLQYIQQEWICFSEIIVTDTSVEWFPDEIPLGLLSRRFNKVTKPIKAISSSFPGAVGPSKPYRTSNSNLERPERPHPNRELIAQQRAQQKDKEKRRLLYRQFWLSNVKLPIEDSLLISSEGIRRLGPPSPACLHIHTPDYLWTTKSVKIPDEAKELCSDALFIWFFFLSFSSQIRISRFDISALFEAVSSVEASGLASEMFSVLLEFVIPAILHSSEEQLVLLENEEAAFIRNNGKTAFVQKRNLQSALASYRSELQNVRTILLNVPLSSETWWSLSVICARYISESEKLDFKRGLIWNLLSDEDGDDERRILESSWVTDELCERKDFSDASIAIRMRLLKTLVDRLVQTPLIKRLIDVSADARLRIQAELSNNEKEERRLLQRINAMQRMIETGNIEEESSPEQVRDQIESDTGIVEKIKHIKEIAETALFDKYSLQWDPIGEDRHGNQYYFISSVVNMVVVHLVQTKSLGVYEGEQSLEALICSMDVRGVHEEKLRRELEIIKREDKPGSIHGEAFNYRNLKRETEYEPEDLIEDHSSESEFLVQTLKVGIEATRMIVTAWLEREIGSFGLDAKEAEENGTVSLLIELCEKADALNLKGPENTLSGEKESEFQNILSLLKAPMPIEKSAIVSALTHLSEHLSSTLLSCWGVYLWTEKSDMLVWRKTLAGIPYRLEKGEDELDESSAYMALGPACQFCGQRFINAPKLNMHLSRWCKMKPEDFSVQPSLENANQSSCVSRLERIVLPVFPLLSTAKMSANTSGVAVTGPFACEVCGKEYSLQSTVAAHQTRWCKGVPAAPKEVEETVEGPPFICKHCNREVSTAQGLIVHLSRWCPEKDYGPSMDLITGFEDDVSTKRDEISPVVSKNEPSEDLDEEALITGEQNSSPLSFSLISCSILWLIDRIDSVSEEVTEKIKQSRRRK